MQVSGNVYDKRPTHFFYGFDDVSRLRQIAQEQIDLSRNVLEVSSRLCSGSPETLRLETLATAGNRLGHLLNSHFAANSNGQLFPMLESINGDSFPVADSNSQFFIPFALATGLEVPPLSNFRRLPDWVSDVSEKLTNATELELNRIKSLDLTTSAILAPRLLIAEDSKAAFERLEYIFSNAGFQVTVATDGVEALETFRNGEFDIVITDNNMPRMNGTDLVPRIRALNSSIPIIMFTNDSYLVKNSPEGVNASIDKSLTRQGEQEFIERARGFIAEAASRN
jgi:CheY-like chemotaxis protein